jgi:ABC-type sugar transport system substrate-binding protein
MALRYAVTSAAFAALLASPALAQETIKIGVIQPLTGSVAYNGTADVVGTKLAVEERNAKGSAKRSRSSSRTASAGRPIRSTRPRS